MAERPAYSGTGLLRTSRARSLDSSFAALGGQTAESLGPTPRIFRFFGDCDLRLRSIATAARRQQSDWRTDKVSNKNQSVLFVETRQVALQTIAQVIRLTPGDISARSGRGRHEGTAVGAGPDTERQE